MRRNRLLVGGPVLMVVGVVLIVVSGGAFIPGDPAVPDVAFSDAGGGRLAVEIGPRSFPATEGIEVRTGSEALNGRLLWKVARTSSSAQGEAATVVVGEVPDGFEETQALEADLPPLWHAEVDNRCYFGMGVAPREAVPEGKVVSTDPTVIRTRAAFRADDRGFSSCDDSTFADRAPAFFGLLLLGIGGVLLCLAWWDWRRGLPTELGGPSA